MSFLEPDPIVTQLVPDEEPAPDPSDELDDLNDTEGLFEAEALEVEEDQRRTIGRSWEFDFVARHFTPGASGPKETRALATLRNWIEKCLRTEGGGRFPIYSTGYGLIGVDREIGESQAQVGLTDLEDRITEALLFHPRITSVSGFRSFMDPFDETLFLNFLVMTDTGEQIEFNDFRLV